MKKLILTIVLFAIVFSLKAQEWDGSQNTTGTIYRSGKVGIGTTNPLGLFQVDDGTFNTILTGNYILFSRSTGPAYIWSNNPGGYMSFGTNGRGTQDSNANLVLKSDLNSYFNSNVGIGTSTPTAGLSIRNDNGLDIRSNTNASSLGSFKMVDGFVNTTSRDDVQFSTGGGFMFQMDDNSNGLNLANNTDQTQGFNVYDRNKNSLFTIVESNGNVGIGSTMPDAKLDVRGFVSVGEESIENRFKIWAGGTGSTNHMRIGTDYAHYGDAVVELYQNYTGGSEQNPGKLIVNGKIGIGTTTPNEKLEIKDGSVLVSNSTNGRTILLDAANGTIEHNGTNSTLQINRFSTSNVSLVTGGGNVGIGTDSPNSILHISDSNPILNIENSGTWYNGDGATLRFGHIQNESNTPLAEIKSSLINGGADGRSGDLKFFTSQGTSQERMVIKFDGNVGIGTATPDAGYKLTVKGNVSSREVKVTATAGGADFVFEDDYNLPSLETVENFIKDKKHLPEIPSAKEMEENGINLAEMNIKLLQKVEELTLYIIEQEKRIKTLETKIIKE